MSFPIGKSPLGLSGLLGLRSGGELPRDLGDLVLPTLDIVQLYGINDYENIAGTVAAPASGTNLFTDAVTGANVVVPPGQVWYIHGFTIQGTVTAAGNLRVQPGVRPAGTAGGSIPIAPELAILAPAANRTYWTTDTLFGRFLPAGYGFVALMADAPVTATVACNLFFSRYRA